GGGAVEVGEGCRQPVGQRRRGRAAVEAGDQRLAVLVVPEADVGGQALPHAQAQDGDRRRVADRHRRGVAELVADLHADRLVDRVGEGVRPVDRQGAAGAGDDAGRGGAVAPGDEGGVGGGPARRVGVGERGHRAAEGGAGGGTEVDGGGRQRGLG